MVSRRQRERLIDSQLRSERAGEWSHLDQPVHAVTVADTPEARAAYEREHISGQLRRLFRQRMDARRLSQQDLATAMGVSEGRVSQILSGDQNLTIRTMAAVSAALDCSLTVDLKPWTEADAPPATEPVPSHAHEHQMTG